ncbi:hypothetical protein ACO2Q7_08640 [Rathayibacter sp. KR2-224]|uniref:hypothetical protein n=1 Tax=Rathayibacter sp. KR2-224 TaxID=3400913 RepID=UPI003C0067C7
MACDEFDDWLGATGEVLDVDPESVDGLDVVGDGAGVLEDESSGVGELVDESSPDFESSLVCDEPDPVLWEVLEVVLLCTGVACHRARPATRAKAELPTPSTAVSVRARRAPRILVFIVAPFEVR